LAGGAGVVKGLVDVVKSAQKEKVVRVGLLSLRNLLDTPELGLGSDMVDAGLPKIIARLQLQVG
jgi:hypothetical protein